MQTIFFDALKWIVTILHDNKIPYRIGGGLAAHIYGSDRPVNDIDISLSGKYFPVIIPLVKDYISAGPKYYENEKWKCTTLSLTYNNREIDLTDSDTLLMSTLDGNDWIENKSIYSKCPDLVMNVNNIDVCLMHPRVLVEYKQELVGEHQKHDINFLLKYIKDNDL